MRRSNRRTKPSRTNASFKSSPDPFKPLQTAVLPAALILLIGLQSPTDASSTSSNKVTQNLSTSWQAELAEGERLLVTKELAKAEYCFRQAVKHSKTAPPDDAVLCLQSLAKTLYMEDEIVETIPLYKNSLKILQRAHGKKSLRTAPTLVTIGGIFEDDGDYKKATKYYTSAIEIAGGTTDNTVQSSPTAQSTLLLADYTHRLGRTQFKQGLISQSEASYLSSLTLVMQPSMQPSTEFIEEVLSDYTTLLISTIYNAKTLPSAFQNELLKDKLGTLTQKKGAKVSNFSTQVSIQMADKAAGDATARSVNSGTSSGTATDTTPNGLDTAKIDPDKKYSDFAALEDINRQRVSFYERMIAADIDSLGAQHPSVARDLNGLASIYLSQRNYAEAKPLLARALEIYEKAYLGDSGPARQTKLLLALISEEQTTGTATIDVSYIDTIPKIPLSAQKIEVALRLNDLAFMLYSQGKVATSLQVYYWALASTAHSTGETSILTASSMIDLSRSLRSSGRSSEAEKFEGNARAIARRDLLDKRSRLLP